jgi:hypothetical protein
MRILVCGSRDWTDRDAVRCALALATTLGEYEETIVVHGGARGADSIAHEVAGEMGFVREVHEAEWDRDGKAAGPIRNDKMAKLGAGLCLAFWDGQSRGTLDMIQRATRHGIPVRIVPRHIDEQHERNRR